MPRLWTAGKKSPETPGDSGPRARLSLPVERGAQQGDPLGPLLHAAALHLVLCHLDWQTGLTIRAFQDDVVAVGPVDRLGGLMRAAPTYGANVESRWVPSKCRAWSPSGCPSPANLTTQ